MKHQKFTLVALFATTLLAGTLMASAISKAKSRGLDPMIIEIMDRVETGTMGNFKLDLPQVLPKRQLNRKYKPAIGVQRDNTSLQIKFADELKVPIAEAGSLYSKTNRGRMESVFKYRVYIKSSSFIICYVFNLRDPHLFSR